MLNRLPWYSVLEKLLLLMPCNMLQHMLTHEGAHATEHRGEGQRHQKARRVLPNLDRPHLHDGDHHCGKRGEGIGVDVWMYVCVDVWMYVCVCVCGRCE